MLSVYVQLTKLDMRHRPRQIDVANIHLFFIIHNFFQQKSTLLLW